MQVETMTYSVVEAGRMLGVGRNTSYRLAKDGVLPVIRLRGQYRVPKQALMRMLKETGQSEVRA